MRPLPARPAPRATHSLTASLARSPDKNPDDKKIADRFARLGVIGNILRDDEKRKQCVALPRTSLMQPALC